MIIKPLKTHDHDRKVSVEKVDILCYSKRQLEKIHPNDDYRIIGETKKNNKKKVVAQLEVEEKHLDISRYRKNKDFLIRK